ncbi:helix-turn-helix domain-containing protein [candidate division KSB1 bacterium]|nr:helix-turn-helix domain-containing protein [candidate division KSB1 bacterium]
MNKPNNHGDFGFYLKRFREARNLKLIEIHGKTDLDTGHLSRLEKGKCKPTKRTVDALADGLQISGEERRAFYEAAGLEYDIISTHSHKTSSDFTFRILQEKMATANNSIHGTSDCLYELGISDPEITKSYQKALSAINEYKSLVSKKLGK